MAIIYTYPSGAVKADDLIIVSEQETAGSPTKNITVGALAAYLGGLPGGPWLPLSAGSSYPLTGDLYMAPTGAGPSVGSRNIVLRGVDDLGNELDSARIFTVDSTINPSGQDLYFQNANDVGVLSTGLFIDAFQQVAIAKTTANAQLDVGGSGNFDTTLLVGTSIGVNMGTPVNHEVDVAGNIRVEGDNAPGGPGTQGTYWLGGNASGDMNFGISSEGASTSTKKFYIGRAFNGITPYLTMWRTTGAPAGIEGRLQLNEYGTGNFITGSGGLGAAVYSLAVDASGNVIESTAGIPWPYQYDLANTILIQGTDPGPYTGTANSTTILGVGAGAALTSTSTSVYIGSNCNTNRDNGESNVYIGANSGLQAIQGTKNTAVGRGSLYNETQGSESVAIGWYALSNQNGSGPGNIANTAVGAFAGNSITTGTENTILGAQSQTAAVSDDNSIIIGYNVTGNGTNSITIGNTTNSGLSLPGGLPKFPDDAAAGAGGILASMLYQTDGTAPAPLNVAGIVMIKQ